MAKIRVEIDGIPDGEKCGFYTIHECSRLNERGNHCFLFDEELRSDRKLPQCIAATVKEKANG